METMRAAFAERKRQQRVYVCDGETIEQVPLMHSIMYYSQECGEDSCDSKSTGGEEYHIVCAMQCVTAIMSSQMSSTCMQFSGS